MPKEDLIEVEGQIAEINSNHFKVTLADGRIVIATLSGKMRKNKIRLSINDRVKLGLSPYDLTKGIIKFRF